MSIYDRWGKKVFESNSISKGWDGNYINGAAALGVYVYVIQYALPGYTERKILKGNVSLLK
jgi:gliding motility-associated-like protein